MNEKEFETNGNTEIVNSWDVQGGNDQNKVLTKSFQGQIPVEPSPVNEVVQPVVETPSEPYKTPDLDFTIAMPKIEEPEVVNNVTPIEGYTVAAPVNDVTPIAFDMPEMVVNKTMETVAPLTDIKDIPVVVPAATTLDSKGNVEINTMSSDELVQHFAGIIEPDEDPLQDIVKRPGDTLVMDALPTNGEMVEPYKEVSDNTFSNIFTAQSGQEEMFNETEKDELEAKPGVPEKKERPELVPPKHDNQYKKVKKRVIPAGWGIGTAIFIILFSYVLFIDDIVSFINNFSYSLK